jgi:hypothetical protein
MRPRKSNEFDLEIIGKIIVHPLKFVAIFNSTPKVLIFSIDPLKVSKFFNSGTHQSNPL